MERAANPDLPSGDCPPSVGWIGFRNTPVDLYQCNNV